MTESIRRGMLTIVAIAVIALPKTAGASPILHVAPQWPGGGLNGSEAARNARHEAHTNGNSSDTSDPGLDDLEFLPVISELSIPPLTTPSQWLADTVSDISTLPFILDATDLHNLLGDHTLIGNELTGQNISALVNDLNPSTPAVVPEPGSLLLLGSGVVGLVVRTRRRRHR